MIIEPTKNTKLIASLMMHSDLFERITDDTSSAMTKEDIIAHLDDKLDRTIFLTAMDNDRIVRGFFECEEQEDSSFDTHPNMLKIGRGPFAFQAAMEVIMMLFTYTNAKILRCRVPSKYLDVLRFASSLGFKLDYMVEKEYVKHGEEYDMYYMIMHKRT